MRTRNVDALVLAEQAAIHNVTFDVAADDGADAELDLAVGKQDARAGLHVLGKRLESGGECSLVAQDFARSNGDGAAGLQQDGLVIFERSGADLGTLEVLQDADGAMLFGRDLAQALDDGEVVGMGAVGEIEAGDVHAGAHEFAHGRLGIAGGANGADDLGATDGPKMLALGLSRGVVVERH